MVANCEVFLDLGEFEVPGCLVDLEEISKEIERHLPNHKEDEWLQGKCCEAQVEGEVLDAVLSAAVSFGSFIRQILEVEKVDDVVDEGQEHGQGKEPEDRLVQIVGVQEV